MYLWIQGSDDLSSNAFLLTVSVLPNNVSPVFCVKVDLLSHVLSVRSVSTTVEAKKLKS